MADRIKNYQQEADQITTLKAIRTDLGVAPSSYTPDATVVTKDRVVTFAQAEEELVVLGDIEKGVKQQVVKGNIADKRITNIEKLLQGNLYDYQTDSSSAYTKTVPSGAMPYAGIEQIGGKTLVWNQLVNSGAPTVATISGHKYYTLIDGTASIVTSSGSAITIVDDTADMVTDLTLCYGSGNEPTTVEEFKSMFPAEYYPYNAGTLLSAGVSEVVSKGKNKSLISGSVPMNGTVTIADFGENISLPYITVSFQCTNVTFTNNTSAAFNFYTDDTNNYALVTGINKADGTQFTKNMSPYTGRAYITLTNQVARGINFYTYTTSYVNWSGAFSDVQVEFSSAMTEYSAPFTISYPIPASIQSLEGYGWSAGNAYNYIDFERKVFVQNVGRVDLGTKTYDKSASGLFSTNVNTSKLVSSSTTVGNLVSSMYVPITSQSITGPQGATPSPNLVMAINPSKTVYFNNTSYSDVGDFKTAMNGVYLYYELETPIETDISAYLTDDNLIEVESGGTLTFPNSNGNDYRIPIPSSETYMVDLQSAL